MFRTAFFYVIACKLGFWQKLISQAPLGSNFGASSLNWLELAQLAWSVCPQTADLSFCHTIQGEDFNSLWSVTILDITMIRKVIMFSYAMWIL